MGNHQSHRAEEACELLSVHAVATLLGCSTRHIYRLVDTRQMPRPIRLGNLVRWRRGQIMSWLEEGCPTEATTQGRCK